MDTTDAVIVPPTPLQRHLQLETDLFCHGCGYNLHGQSVYYDERLGFLICRCPECGRFHPAAMGVSVSRPWLARLGVGLVANLVLFYLLVLGLGGLFTGICMYIHLDEYSVRSYSSQISGPVRTMRPAHNRQTVGSDSFEPWESDWMIAVAVVAGLGLFMGAFTSIVAWHLNRWERRWFLLLPVLTAVAVWLIWQAEYELTLIAAWSMRVIALYAVCSMFAMWTGQLIGRPIGRQVVRLLIPPKLRQHVAFLWRCDGLPLPASVAQ